LKNLFYAILLIFAFVTALLQPVVPFVQFYMADQNEIAEISNNCDCACYKKETAKMESNGDAYLKALIKRVCKDQKDKSPKVPVVTISVFVKTLYSTDVPVYNCPKKNYNQISDFIIQPPLSSYLEELLKPPQIVLS